MEYKVFNKYLQKHQGGSDPIFVKQHGFVYFKMNAYAI